MSNSTFATITADDIAAAQKNHAAVFPTARASVLFWGIWIAVIAYVIGSLWYFEIYKLFAASNRAWRLLSSFFVWRDMNEWMYSQIYVGIAQTVGMAFLGTLLGSCAALGIGFLGARNTMKLGLFRHIVRRILDVFRGVDQLVWGLVFVRAVGLGPLAGVLAIFISDMGTLSKLYAEAIENVDSKQVEGVRATGAGPFKTVRFGYLPQVLPVFVSQSLYFFESSTRSATILGIVGAGGVGMIIIERFRAGLYDQVAFVVLNVLVIIAIIDWMSKKVRQQIIGSSGE